MYSRIAGVLTVTALVAGCTAYGTEPGAVAQADADRDCFFLSQVSGYHPAGRDTIHVNVGPRRTYEFKTFGSCSQLDYSEAIAFDKNGPGTICRGIDVDLIVPTSIGPQRCAVSMIRRLPEER